MNKQMRAYLSEKEAKVTAEPETIEHLTTLLKLKTQLLDHKKNADIEKKAKDPSFQPQDYCSPIDIFNVKLYSDIPKTTAVAPTTAKPGPIQPQQLIEVVLNDRLGRKCRIKCYVTDTIIQVKRLAAAQLGSRAEKMRLQRWNTVFKDHLTLEDYEVSDGSNIDLYYF